MPTRLSPLRRPETRDNGARAIQHKVTRYPTCSEADVSRAATEPEQTIVGLKLSRMDGPGPGLQFGDRSGGGLDRSPDRRGGKRGAVSQSNSIATIPVVRRDVARTLG